MIVTQEYKLLNIMIRPSLSLVLANRIIRNLTNEILANYINKVGSLWDNAAPYNDICIVLSFLTRRSMC